MAGHEAQENNWESLDGSRTNFLFNSVHELNAGDATTAKANSSRGSSAIESYFGRLNYNFADRYLLTAPSVPMVLHPLPRKAAGVGFPL